MSVVNDLRGEPLSAGRPLVSVLMPSFNSGAFIDEAVRSILALGRDDIEILIQDGGSTDETLEVVALIDDPRVRFVSEPDGGQSDALNRALDRARGDWVGWLNADDLYIKPGASHLIETLDAPYDFVYGDMDTVDVSGERIKHYRGSRPLTVANLLRHGCFINCSAGFYRADKLRELGAIDAALHYCMDYELLLRLVANGIRSRYVPADVMSLRWHENTKTATGHASHEFVKEAREIQRRYVDLVLGGRIRAWAGVAVFRMYVRTLPLWRTAFWRRIRPGKRL